MYLTSYVFNKFLDDYFNQEENHIINNYCLYDEKTKEYKFVFLTPGFKKDDIDITIDNKKLEIICSSDNDIIKKIFNKNNLKFIKYIDNIDGESINAKLENGILEIKLKIKEDKTLQKIKIY